MSGLLNKYVLSYRDEKTGELVCEIYNNYSTAHDAYKALNSVSRQLFRVVKEHNEVY